MLPTSQDYQSILLNSSGLLDVRAPIEFNSGAFPQAANLPLLNDQEREQVGICYKKEGQQQAIALGNQLVCGDVKQERLSHWLDFIKQHDHCYLYCFRGGLRSKISQQWIRDAGVDISRVEGGYKALRNFLLDQIESANNTFNYTLIGGLTGCQKTELINSLEYGIDLEGAAYHRGSSFGAHALPQSGQINFENTLAIDLLKANQAQFKHLALEDEGRFIGSVDIPKHIFAKMRTSPLVIIERPLDERLQQLLTEYIINMQAEFNAIQADNTKAFESFSNYLLESLARIKKRLGNEAWANLNNRMQSALRDHQLKGDVSAHYAWLEPLLVNYYDPMYRSQIENRKENIAFRGNYEACKHYLNESL